MFQEETRCAWHREDIGIGSTDVTSEFIIVAIGIVIVHEGHAVALVGVIVAEHGLRQVIPVAPAKG